MEEDEAALLAELRAISNRSAASRFQDEEETKNDGDGMGNTSICVEQNELNDDIEVLHVEPKQQISVEKGEEKPKNEGRTPRRSKRDKQGTPPWKQAREEKKQPMEFSQVEVSAPQAEEGASIPSSNRLEEESDRPGFKSELPSTFKGDCGGAAEDADLLAELRAISARSSGTNRFTENQSEKIMQQNHALDLDDAEGSILETNQVKTKSETPAVSATSAVCSKGADFTTPSTFKGERGGSAEDAELLAELRAVSGKSASSRFAETDLDNSLQQPESDSDQPGKIVPRKQPAQPLAEPSTASSPLNDNVMVHNKSTIRNDAPSTFKGDRGGSAEDAELLAELRAVSAKSRGSGRFGGEEVDLDVQQASPSSDVVEQTVLENTLVPSPTEPQASPSLSSTSLAGGESNFKSDTPSTFKGDCCGSAEDEELLAELRAISAKSTGASRFAEADTDEDAQKRGLAHNDPVEPVTEPVKVPTPGEPSSVPSASQVNTTGGESKFKSDVPSTFKGDRGGSAEDAELLAELRAVSLKSTGRSRFGEAEDCEDDPQTRADSVHPAEPTPVSPLAEAQDSQPAGPSGPSIDSTDGITSNFKSEISSTFQGERGGSAEDANLLAELRPVSSNSTGATRFAEADDDGNKKPPGEALDEPVEPATSPERTTSLTKRVPVSSASPVDSSGGESNFESDLPSTFKGDRGGSAEDAELLTELRAVSSKSTGSSRFSEGEANENVPQPVQLSDAIPAAPPAEAQDEQQAAVPSDLSIDSAGGKLNFKSEISSTFQGERGGRAEDANLLAELRAVSSKSTGVSRFSEDAVDTDTVQPGPNCDTKPTIPEPMQAAHFPEPLPVVSTTPVELGSSTTNFTSDSPSTFKGDRGGTAEDAELLAELRAVSAKSTSSTRFAKDDIEDATGSDEPAVQSWLDEANSLSSKTGASEGQRSPKKSVEALPPWKKGNASRQVAPAKDSISISVAAPVSQMPESESSVEDGSPPTPKQSQKAKGGIPPWKRKVKGPKNASQADSIKIATARSSPPKQRKDGVSESGPRASTFRGDRDGAAEDAELLAELMAISSKSGCTSRFAEDVGDAQIEAEAGPSSAEVQATHQPRQGLDNRGPTPISTPPADKPCVQEAPTEQNKGDHVPMEDNTEKASSRATDVEARTAGCSESAFQSLPSTFKGDRGGPAEDADLLAELQAISSKASNSRFSEDAESTARQEDADVPSIPVKTSHPNDNDAEINTAECTSPKNTRWLPPPWKKKKSAQHADASSLDVEISVANDAPKPQSASASLAASKSNSVPPWKKGKKPPKCDTSSIDSVEISVADKGMQPNTDSATDNNETVELSNPTPASNPSFTSSLPSMFKGERGGTAEDAELLAELRAISSNSSSAKRFSDDIANDASAPAVNAKQKEAENSNTEESMIRKQALRPLPPWKRASRTRKLPSASVPNSTEEGGSPNIAVNPNTKVQQESSGTSHHGIKSSLPSTFKGDRGGAAEDAELLAELCAISSRSGTSSRFAEDDQNKQELRQELNTAKMPKDAVISTIEMRKKGVTSSVILPSTFKGERGGPAEDPALLAELQAVSLARETSTSKNKSSEPIHSNQRGEEGLKSSVNLPSTFRGDRGGPAEDAELLAELRAISSASGTTSKLDCDGSKKCATSTTVQESATMGNSTTANCGKKADAPPPAPTSNQMRSGFGGTPELPGQTSSAAPDDLVVTTESLPSAIIDKNWKMRRQAFEFLSSRLSSIVGGRERAWDIDGNTVMEGLDEMMPPILKETNASALDGALQFACMYAEHCKAATDADHAAAMAGAVLNGSSFSSSRPTTQKWALAFFLKLMEVGSHNSCSVHSVIDQLLNKGLKSRKPKEVISTSKLILEAAQTFGAACLPLSAVAQGSAALLSHANAQVREIGMCILAEICRALGSKEPIQQIIDKLKKAQLAQLDSLIEKQPNATKGKIRLRSQAGSSALSSPDDVMAAFQAGAEEAEARQFASRKAVDIIQEVQKTEFESRVKETKWSEKVAALDILIKCGGKEPFKLCQPSPSVDYTPIVRQLKGLLSHSHFAVCSKALAALSMLAEGVGEKIYPNLRPLLPTLLQLLKDKKLTRASSSCLDSVFGNVFSFEHLINQDGVREALDERKQKNALARKSIMDFLVRCVQRHESAGPRGRFAGQTSANVAQICTAALNDSDAGVRKSALEALKSIITINDPDTHDAIAPVMKDLERTNARAFKSITIVSQQTSVSAGVVSKAPSKPAVNSPTKSTPRKQPKTTSNEDGAAKTTISKQPSKRRVQAVTLTSGKSQRAEETSRAGEKLIAAEEGNDTEGSSEPALEESLSILEGLSIPKWNLAEDEDGVLARLKSSSWKFRKGAIESLSEFFTSTYGEPGNSALPSPDFVVVVKAHTKGMKESNFNVTKAIMCFLRSICEIHEQARVPLSGWICKSAVSLSVEKIADKKLSSVSKELLTALCTVRSPQLLLGCAIKVLSSVKLPAGHEGFLNWFSHFCKDFGAKLLGNGIKDVVEWLIMETKNANIKVRKEAFVAIGLLHIQLGPVFKALILSAAGDGVSPSVKSQLDAAIESSPFDPNASELATKTCIALVPSSGNSAEKSATPTIDLEVTKTDLVASLPSGCIAMMSTKEGKTAWKMRKQAMEDVERCLSKCNGLVSTSPSCLNSLAELVRALRDRLSDSQSNLKPMAAKMIGNLLASLDSGAQARLGKLVFPSLLTAAMNDIKKVMREAALESLRLATTKPSLEGGGTNSLSSETMMVALSSALTDAALKSAGLSDVLALLSEIVESSINWNDAKTSKDDSLDTEFAPALVKCLTSSKSETRAAVESLLEKCLEHNIILLSSVQKGTKQLLPAQKRAVDPVINRLKGASGESMGDQKVEKQKAGSRRQSLPVAKSAVRKKSTRLSLDSRSSLSALSSSKKNVSTQQRLYSEPPALIQEEEEEGTETKNPLAPSTKNVSSTKEGRLGSSKRDHWPEHPEEPAGTKVFSALKREWSMLLRPDSLSTLFPSSGIRKQEDAAPGCELLGKCLAPESNGDYVFQQLDLIFKWISFALCAREDTVGMQALVSLLVDLFAFISDSKYQISETEAALIIPFVLEKASVAKGRFRDSFDSLIHVLESGDVFPLQKYGSLICISLIERSKSGKTRALASNQCKKCVEKLGLAGIGKRGVVVTAKSFSDETSPESNNALLELIECILVKMNGDLARYFKVCGLSALSGKARKLIEEKWEKHTRAESKEVSRPSPPNKKTVLAHSTSWRQNTAPNARKSSIGYPGNAKTLNSSSSAVGVQEKKRVIHDELPSFKIRSGSAVDGTRKSLGKSRHESDVDLFTFSFQSSLPDEVNAESNVRAPPPDKATLPRRLENSSQNDEQTSGNRATHQVSTSKGSSAASLRARLQQLREKQRTSELPAAPSISTVGNSEVAPDAVDENFYDCMSSSDDRNEVISPLDQVYRSIEELISVSTPLLEDDQRVQSVIESVKRVNLSLAVDLASVNDAGEDSLQSLKRSVLNDISTLVVKLTSIFAFAFENGAEGSDCGIFVALLSVTLATLMALFRDSELSSLISQGCVTSLIRQATTALLDPRLAAGSVTRVSQLDQSISSQLVKAVNKLAIQAAVGSSRHTSLQSLMALQVQFCKQQAERKGSASLSARSSRVVTKLFARVIKAEEATPSPFFGSSLDIESVLCSLEDLLVACNDAQAPDGNTQDIFSPATNMSRSLVMSILSARGPGSGTQEIRDSLDDLGIDSRRSLLGKLVSSCDRELNQSVDLNSSISGPLDATEALGSDVASLVSALGRSAEGAERRRALEALREYTDKNGEVDLRAFLDAVSAPFRAFILEQLSTVMPGTAPPTGASQPTSVRPQTEYSQSLQAFDGSSVTSDNSRSASSTMSERIRHLKSKLSVTEASVQSVMKKQDSSQELGSKTAYAHISKHGENASSLSSMQRNPGLAAKLSARRDRISTDTSSVSSSLVSVAERSENSGRTTSSRRPSRSKLGTGSAASLRARLEAVKQGQRHQDDDAD